MAPAGRGVASGGEEALGVTVAVTGGESALTATAGGPPAGAPGSCRLAFAGDDSPRLRSHPSELIIQRIASLTYMEI